MTCGEFYNRRTARAQTQSAAVQAARTIATAAAAENFWIRGSGTKRYTAVIAAPIAVDIAARLNVNPDPFLMAVAVAASCAFLTPIGHKNNTLIMGPGGYRFGDYWRMGLPLELLVILVAVPMILWVWPFQAGG